MVVFDEALSTAGAIGYDWYRADVLSSLAPRLPESLLGRALSLAYEIDDEEGQRTSVLAALAPYLPKIWLGEVLSAMCNTEDDNALSYTLDFLAPYLPDDSLGVAWHIACAIRQEHRRADAMRALTPRLANWGVLQPQSTYALFADTLPILAMHPRPAFLRDLEALLPFVLSLDGDEVPQTAIGIFHAIQEICTWWP